MATFIDFKRPVKVKVTWKNETTKEENYILGYFQLNENEYLVLFSTTTGNRLKEPIKILDKDRLEDMSQVDTEPYIKKICTSITIIKYEIISE